MLLAGLAIGDEHVQTAMRRLERVVREHRTWAKVTAPIQLPATADNTPDEQDDSDAAAIEPPEGR